MEKKSRTALLITFYWPPAGGPGVHRWLRFSRFFKENGWDLHVYCPEDAEWPIIDPALEQSVSKELTIVRRKIFEPHKYLGKKNNPNVGGGLTRAKKSSFFQQLVIWVRGNFFVPDARVFWIKPSARFLNKYLKQHPEIDTIISTGPPHSMHVIAQRLKETHPQLTWVADFRDPWTEIDFYKELMTGASADRRQKKLEKGVPTGADLVISVSEDCASGLARIGGRKVEVVTNGFTFPEFDAKAVRTDAAFTIAHFGSMSFPRNPEILWKVLAQLLPGNAELAKALKIRLIGPVDINVIERVQHYGLESYLELIPNVSHTESLDMQRATQVLLLVANKTPNVKGILTGKFFEYLGAKRPVLAIGEKDSNLETIVNDTRCGVFADYDDEAIVANAINEWFAAYRNGTLFSEPVNTEQFSSGKIVEQLLGLIENGKPA